MRWFALGKRTVQSFEDQGEGEGQVAGRGWVGEEDGIWSVLQVGGEP